VLYRIIENYIREQLDRSGYDEVRTPQLFQKGLWEKSGHMEHYEDHIYATGDDMLFKPMNCPGHVQIFNTETVSHKQLPMRMAEFGCCHRNEPSGALNGLFRVRQFVQDDAHIFCAPEHIEAEIKAFCDLLDTVYRKFGFEDYSVAISLRPDKRAGDDALWDRAEADLIRVVERLGIPFRLLPGEGAFYGPKLEFALKDSHGREWQCGTAQLDFILPERLGARYAHEDGTLHHPVMIHRAILGSIERFIAILLEHTEGHLPMWLAPVPVVILAMSDDKYIIEACVNIRDFIGMGGLHEYGNRVKIDQQYDANMMVRVRQWASIGAHVIVIGEKEQASNLLSVRRAGQKKVEQVELINLLPYLNS
jgi:threonyl-tRNA synthetase